MISLIQLQLKNEGKKGGNIQRIMTQQHVDDEEFKATTLLLWALSSTRCVHE